VGKASGRKAERRQGIGPSRADFEKRRNYQVLMTGMQRMLGEIEADEEREQQARKAWTGGADPTPAPLAQWREDSVGDRFFAGADELVLETGEDSDFPETHGPLFLLGACALTDATWRSSGWTRWISPSP